MSSAEQQARDKAVARRDQLAAWELENAAKQYGAVGDLVRELAHFGAGGTVSNPVRLVKDAVAELCRLRAQETRIRALADEWFKQARDPSFDNYDAEDRATSDTLNECAYEVYDAIGALDEEGCRMKPAALDTEEGQA